MAKKIIIRPGMSKYQIKRQLEKAYNDAINKSTITWTCGHGYVHKIPVGRFRNREHTLYCGCTVRGR